MIFVDGIGLGADDPSVNPLAHDRPGFVRLSGGARWTAGAHFASSQAMFRGIDANLGLEGLPQSGTGQATLFTGVNCAALAGRHYGPFPHSATRDTIRKLSIFARVGSGDAAFANAYPPRFFNWVRKRDRWPVTTRACLDAGVHIRTIDDLEAGRGVAADVTGRGLSRHLKLPVLEITPAQAADRLLAMSSENRFTLFEVFHTDKAGHAQDADAAEAILRPLDQMLEATLKSLPPDTTLVLTSDHGNLEDLSTRTHTRNPVPLAVAGPGTGAFTGVTDLTGVTPAIMRILSA